MIPDKETIVWNHYRRGPDTHIRAKVHRPTEYGNPHDVGFCRKCKTEHTRAEAIELFRAHFNEQLKDPSFVQRIKYMLKGRALVCFCAPNPCHADVIAEYLNKLE